MGKRKSFTEYIRENFENQIYQSVEEYYNANKERLRGTKKAHRNDGLKSYITHRSAVSTLL